VILTKESKMILTPTYHVMKMYSVHQDATLIPVKCQSPLYEFNGESIPAISISASKDGQGKIHVSIVNIDAEKANEVELDVEGLNIKKVMGTILKSAKLQDHNTFEDPNLIVPTDFKEFKLKKGKLTLTMPPFSVVVLETE